MYPRKYGRKKDRRFKTIGFSCADDEYRFAHTTAVVFGKTTVKTVFSVSLETVIVPF